MCRKSAQEEESYHIFCPFLALARHGVEIFGSAWLEPTEIKRGLVKMVLV
jgi:hypothetical protein